MSPSAPLAAAASPARRIPVISFIRGVGDSIRSALAASASPAGELFRSGELEVIDVPIPRLVGNKQNPMTGPYEEDPGRPVWELTSEQRALVADADVVVMDAHSGGPVLLAPRDNLPADKQQLFDKLRWVQGTYAGVEMYLEELKRQGEGRADPRFVLTRAGGIMPRLMGQYVFGYVTMLERKLLEARDFQSMSNYARIDMADYRSPRAVTVGILGLGDIGQGVGRMLKAAGYRVLGFKKRATHVPIDAADRVTSDVDELLAASDYVVNVLPSTADTRHLLTRERLEQCRAKAPVFVNIGRGDVIEEVELVRALNDGLFSKAVLDVFEQEPLPAESELWRHPNVLLTPHVSGKVFPEDVAEVFVANLDRFLAGEQVQFAVDWTLGY